MELRFTLSGSTICSIEADCVPSLGSTVTIRTTSYKKGLNPGSLISFTVSDEWPPIHDFSERGPVVYIDANGYEELEKGPDPQE